MISIAALYVNTIDPKGFDIVEERTEIRKYIKLKLKFQDEDITAVITQIKL